jgi:hypothetical protein
MPRYYIEIPHESEKIACARAVHELLKTGSHFLTNADFSCNDGDHKARIIVEVESKEAARAIIPPEYRHNAKIVQLNKFTVEEMEDFLNQHT